MSAAHTAAGAQGKRRGGKYESRGGTRGAGGK